MDMERQAALDRMADEHRGSLTREQFWAEYAVHMRDHYREKSRDVERHLALVGAPPKLTRNQRKAARRRARGK